MLTLTGSATSRGIAIAPLFLCSLCSAAPQKRTVENTDAEAARAEAALQAAKQQLTALHDKAVLDAGNDAAAIFEIHAMLLEDKDYLEAVYSAIRVDALCAEYAVYRAGMQFSSLFQSMDDAYMKERAADITDVSMRVAALLTGEVRDDPLSGVEQPVILAADTFSPSQTMQLDKAKIAAFVTRTGAFHSHASILARSLGIPAVAALGDAFGQLENGVTAIVDGIDGLVLCNPGATALAQYQAKARTLSEAAQRQKLLRGKSAVTCDGFSVALCANIGQPDEVWQALSYDAEGIGLFRSEFLFLGHSAAPSEETQFEAYKKVLTAMAPRPVAVRTLDLGADKQTPCLPLPFEENPALGYRAIRISLDRAEEIFVPQLRALLRASVYGALSILFPMITGVQEVHSILSLLDTVKGQLRKEHIPYSEAIKIGIMIETPAAVIMADKLAGLVDFFSIGTNDLTQYTLAADRMNPQVSYLFDAGNPAILRMIRRVVDCAHAASIPVCICGESAADVALVPYYIGMGVDELSMSAPSILRIKEYVRGLDGSVCQRKCANALI
ncbi:MAG: phosphoenolpyruvate--protein phosphotransferase [Ruthenibacterium sp.]